MKSNIIFKVITPIFISSGEEYYPQDYFIDDRFYFIDRDKFFKYIEQKGLFEEFLKVSEDIYELLDFIDNNFQKDLAKDVIDIDDGVADELLDTISRPVSAFIKDKFYFKPFIPGSSLKGVIRTALLDYKINKFKDDEEVKRVINQIKKERCSKKLNQLYKNLETIIFCNANKNNRGYLQYDAKKDILKALFVDDLKPIDYKLKIIKPKNRPYKDEDNEIPVILESLIDGEFRGEVKIDENLLNLDKNLRNNIYFKDEPLSIDLIKKSLKDFYTKIIDIEKNRFRAEIPSYEEYLIKIGKFSGAGSKSLNDLRQISIRQIKKCFDYQLSVWIDENENALGWGKLIFN